MKPIRRPTKVWVVWDSDPSAVTHDDMECYRSKRMAMNHAMAFERIYEYKLFTPAKKGKTCMNASQIATLITIAEEALSCGTLTLEHHGELNAALWANARAIGVAPQVDQLLQDLSDQEMSEALTEAQCPF